MKESVGYPPFNGLEALIEAAGYRVISIGAERSDSGFAGVISLQIAPAIWLNQTDFVCFPQIPQDLVLKCREYTAQSCQQEKDSCQE